jgi:hypothetical protein
MLAAKKYAVEIGGMHGAPVFERSVLGIMRGSSAVKASYTGVVDDAIEPAFARKDRINDADPVRFAADIKRFMTLLQVSRNARGARAIEIADDHAGAFACEGLSDRGANSLRRSRDECDFSVKPH